VASVDKCNHRRRQSQQSQLALPVNIRLTLRLQSSMKDAVEKWNILPRFMHTHLHISLLHVRTCTSSFVTSHFLISDENKVVIMQDSRKMSTAKITQEKNWIYIFGKMVQCTGRDVSVYYCLMCVHYLFNTLAMQLLLGNSMQYWRTLHNIQYYHAVSWLCASYISCSTLLCLWRTSLDIPACQASILKDVFRRPLWPMC